VGQSGDCGCGGWAVFGMQQVEDVGGQQVRFGMAQRGDEGRIDPVEMAVESVDTEQV
jgi:hypothetical protein